MKKQTYISALWQRKWAIIAIALSLFLLTVGLPSYNGEWSFHSVREIEHPVERFGFSFGLICFILLCLLQVRNEWKRGNGDDVKMK
jgi:hypothetical protein